MKEIELEERRATHQNMPPYISVTWSNAKRYRKNSFDRIEGITPRLNFNVVDTTDGKKSMVI
jgi:hypothetical protein